MDDDVVVRAAEHADVRALHELDLASRTTTSSPAPARADQPVDDVLMARPLEGRAGPTRR